MADCLNWTDVRDLAMALALPCVSSGDLASGPCLRAHGRVWIWWDRRMAAPGLRLPRGERPFLIASDPDIFFVTPDIQPYNQVLAHPEKVSRNWLQGHLLLSWRALAPQLFLQLFPGEGPPVPSFSSL